MKKLKPIDIVNKYHGDFDEFDRLATREERKIIMSYNIKSTEKKADHGKRRS